MSEQTRIHFCDMAEAHIDELEQENSTLKDRVTELEGIEEDQRMWKGRMQFLEWIANGYKEQVRDLEIENQKRVQDKNDITRWLEECKQERDEALARATSLEKKLVASVNREIAMQPLLQRYYELHFQRDLNAFVLSGCSLCQQAKQLLSDPPK